jgi:hypothetical protein
MNFPVSNNNNKTESLQSNNKIYIEFCLVPNWPKLAWVADFQKGERHIRLRHGPFVEVREDWCLEGVWAGEFERADFDQSEFIFGSGVRIRHSKVFFVTASTMLDRLWYCDLDSRIHVANSLPAILACAGLELDNDYLAYAADIETLTKGVDGYQRQIPAKPCSISILYYRNLFYDGTCLKEVDKPQATPDFASFSDYYDFLRKTSAKLGENLCSSFRRFRVTPIGCLSSGYDSGAATVIAREAGCRSAATIVNASSFFPRSDSGLEIARYLGIECHPYRHKISEYRHETSVWSAGGMPAGLNLTIFRYPEPLSLLFTGYRGDTVWDDYVSDDSRRLSAPTIAGLGLCEFRLMEGIFHCPVPCWGGMKTRQIQAISRLPEMDSWRLNRSYDRPIPRRILEEASVPRGLFGVHKEATTADNFFIWPFSSAAIKSFDRFLKSNRVFSMPPYFVGIVRKIAKLLNLVYSNIPKRFRYPVADPRRLLSIKAQSLLFQWANLELKRLYAWGLDNNKEQT